MAAFQGEVYIEMIILEIFALIILEMGIKALILSPPIFILLQRKIVVKMITFIQQFFPNNKKKHFALISDFIVSPLSCCACE